MQLGPRCRTRSDPACNKQLRARVCYHQYWLENLVNIPWNKWQWDNFTDAVYQDISTVGRHVWAEVLGEFYPQKPRIPHQPGSTLRPRMCRQYLWTVSHKEESVSFASFTWYTENKRENICQSQDKRESGKRIAATNVQPFISRRPVSTSQLISLVYLQVHNLICQLLHFSVPLKKACVSKERVALDLLVVFRTRIMASATLLKSSFLHKKAEWGATRQAATPKPVTVSMVVHASAYAKELVETAV